MKYTVTWEIDNIFANTPQEAANLAYALQAERYPGTLANHFTVTDEDGNQTEVDAE